MIAWEGEQLHVLTLHGCMGTRPVQQHSYAAPPWHSAGESEGASEGEQLCVVLHGCMGTRPVQQHSYAAPPWHSAGEGLGSM